MTEHEHIIELYGLVAALAERLAALEKVAASFAPGNDYGHTHRALSDAGLVPPPSSLGKISTRREGTFGLRRRKGA